MKKILAGLVLALLVASPAAAGQASITAPDGLSFGDTFTVEFTAPRNYNGGLWARGECRQESVVWVQYVNLDDTSTQDGPFVLGPTPSWSGGGAECNVTLLVLNGYRADRVLASDAFVVVP